MMIDPVRRELGFTLALNPTVWVPAPFPPTGAAIMIHEYVVVAFQEQPVPDVTENEPLPPETPIDCEPVVIE